VACSTPNDAWWPASLFRFSHRDRLDAGPGVRLAAASGRRIVRIGAALDGLGARCPRSYHPEPSGAKHGNRPTRRMPSRADRTGRCIFLSTALDCRSTARANGWRRSMAPDPAVVGESCMWHRMPIAARSLHIRRPTRTRATHRRWSRCSTRSMVRSGSSQPTAPMTGSPPTTRSPTTVRLPSSSFHAQQTEVAIGCAALNRMLACARPKSIRRNGPTT